MLELFKKPYFYGFLLCAGALTFIYHGENVLGIHPCALCSLQRICLWLVSGIFLISLMCSCSFFKCLLKIVNFFVILSGIGIAVRQLWLEYHMVTMHTGCAPSLEKLLDTYPMLTAIKQALTTTQYCSNNLHKFFGFSFAHWILAVFVIALLIIFIACKSNKECKLFHK